MATVAVMGLTALVNLANTVSICITTAKVTSG